MRGDPDIYFVYHPAFEKQVRELALAVGDLIPEEVEGELAIEPGPARLERERLLQDGGDPDELDATNTSLNATTTTLERTNTSSALKASLTKKKTLMKSQTTAESAGALSRSATNVDEAFQSEPPKPFKADEALAAAALVVLFLSPNALDSKVVQQEVMATMKKKKSFWIVHPLRTCPFIWPELQKPGLPVLEEMIQVYFWRRPLTNCSTGMLPYAPEYPWALGTLLAGHKRLKHLYKSHHVKVQQAVARFELSAREDANDGLIQAGLLPHLAPPFEQVVPKQHFLLVYAPFGREVAENLHAFFLGSLPQAKVLDLHPASSDVFLEGATSATAGKPLTASASAPAMGEKAEKTTKPGKRKKVAKSQTKLAPDKRVCDDPMPTAVQGLEEATAHLQKRPRQWHVVVILTDGLFAELPAAAPALRVAIENGVNISLVAHSRYCASAIREVLTAPADLCRALIGIPTIPYMGECGAGGLFELAVRTYMLQKRPPKLAEHNPVELALVHGGVGADWAYGLALSLMEFTSVEFSLIDDFAPLQVARLGVKECRTLGICCTKGIGKDHRTYALVRAALGVGARLCFIVNMGEVIDLDEEIHELIAQADGTQNAYKVQKGICHAIQRSAIVPFNRDTPNATAVHLASLDARGGREVSAEEAAYKFFYQLEDTPKCFDLIANMLLTIAAPRVAEFVLKDEDFIRKCIGSLVLKPTRVGAARILITLLQSQWGEAAADIIFKELAPGGNVDVEGLLQLCLPEEEEPEMDPKKKKKKDDKPKENRALTGLPIVVFLASFLQFDGFEKKIGKRSVGPLLELCEKALEDDGWEPPPALSMAAVGHRLERLVAVFELRQALNDEEFRHAVEQLAFCKEINCDAVAVIPLYSVVLAKFKSMNLPTYKPDRDLIIVCPYRTPRRYDFLTIEEALDYCTSTYAAEMSYREQSFIGGSLKRSDEGAKIDPKTIRLFAGEYKEDVSISVPVCIENEFGASKPGKIVWSGEKPNQPMIRIQNNATLWLTGLSIDHNVAAQVYNGGINARACKFNGSIRVSGGFGANLEDCHFRGESGYVQAMKSTAKLNGCSFTGAKNAMVTTGEGHVDAISCKISKCIEAAGNFKGHSSMVLNSYIENCPVGFAATGTGPFTFRGNEIHGGTEGLRLAAEAVVEANLIRNMSTAAVVVDHQDVTIGGEAKEGELSENKFFENGCGVVYKENGGGSLEANVFTKNQTAVEVLSTTQDCVSVIGNEFSLSEGEFGAIAVKNKSKPFIKKNVFKGNVACGITVSGYSYAQVLDNKFVENGLAAHVDAWSGIQFLRNDMREGQNLVVDPDPKGFREPSRPDIERDDEELA
jgi:hypothetical protein